MALFGRPEGHLRTHSRGRGPLSGVAARGKEGQKAPGGENPSCRPEGKAARMTERRSPQEATLVGRLAPSPTGVMHLGNARSFLLAWLSIRSRGGRILLRIEDIDGPRIKEGATERCLEDLEWLGLDWDGEPWIQTERLDHYEAATDLLVAAGRAYPCVCTRREVEEAATAPHDEEADARQYPGTCRGRWRDEEDARRHSGRDPALRLRVDEEAIPFIDGFCGPLPGRLPGDFVIRKRDGGPAYQLAVVVDDAASGVTEVLRADDLIPSTPRQLLLYRFLGLTAPEFFHTPLVVGGDGRRLAKRHGDTSLATFRSRGVPAERVVGYLAAISGLAPEGACCEPGDLVASFDLQKIVRQPVVAQDPPFAVG